MLREWKLAETEARFEVEVVISQPQWFAARCSVTDHEGREDDLRFSAIKTAEPDPLVRDGIAHTSAILVTVAGQRPRSPTAVAFWVGRLRSCRHRIATEGVFANDDQRQQALAYVDAGIAGYQALLTE